MGGEIVKQDLPASGPTDRPSQQARACPACGAAARRLDARFCSTCGRSLSDSYLPADALRASYHLQHRADSGRKPKGIRSKSYMASTFPSNDGNAPAATALAFVTYSLVPYLGIFFCPGAVVLGVIGIAYSFRAPRRSGGRRAAYFSVAFGLVILGVQILLWWIIIKVPGWTRPF